MIIPLHLQNFVPELRSDQGLALRNQVLFHVVEFDKDARLLNYTYD